MYDVVVIGGGPGGYAAAIRASQLGGKIALVEAEEMGGTCVNRGCIPSKVWLRAAHVLHWIRNGHELGIKTQGQTVDLQALGARKNGVANDIRMGMEGLLTNNRVEVVRGRAALKGPREIQVNGRTLEAKKTIVATGSALRIPDVPGIEEAAMTTDQALDMTALPGSLLIWGVAGPIEVEIASLMNTLGCKVFLAFEGRRILPMEDGDTGQRLGQALREQGIELLPRLTLQSVQKQETGFLAVLSGAEERRVEVERVLVSARKPNTAALGLEEVGIRLDEKGFIKINDRLASSVEGIYAVGDATGGWMLSHAASSMAVVAAENALGAGSRYPFNRIPRCLWTQPEMAAVGLSEEEAERKGHEVETGAFPYAINGLAMVRNQVDGAVKIVSDARYGEILGVHIVGSNATEIIGEAVLAMQLEATVQELARSIRVHPTFSESGGGRRPGCQRTGPCTCLEVEKAGAGSMETIPRAIEVVDWGVIGYGEALRARKAWSANGSRTDAPTGCCWSSTRRWSPSAASGGLADLCVAPEALARKEVALHHADRGGRATFHGPGQLVAYPILKLEEKDLHAYLRRLLEMLADVLRTSGLIPEFRKGTPGVWVGGRQDRQRGHRRPEMGDLSRRGPERFDGSRVVQPDRALRPAG